MAILLNLRNEEGKLYADLDREAVEVKDIVRHGDGNTYVSYVHPSDQRIVMCKYEAGKLYERYKY